MHKCNFVLTKRKHSNNTLHCYRQCTICGTSSSVKKPENFEKLPDFNELLPELFFQMQSKIYCENHKREWTGIKPIITKYKGIYFRSRMEARTAVFLDALGIKWEYEKEGYELGNGNGEIIRYLPDFYIPKQYRFDECFIEVKGKEPEHNEHLKAFLLCNYTKLPVYFLFDFPYIEKGERVKKHIEGYVFCTNPQEKDNLFEGAVELCDVIDDYEFPNLVKGEYNQTSEYVFCQLGIAADKTIGIHLDSQAGSNAYMWPLDLCDYAYDIARNAKFEFST